MVIITKKKLLTELEKKINQLIPNFKGQHLITIASLNKQNIKAIVELASCFKKFSENFDGNHSFLRNKILTTIFYEPSTRTRCSFEAAMLHLGGKVLTISDVATSSVAKGESLEDTLKTVECYSHVIVLRHPIEGSMDRAVKALSNVSLINAGDGTGEHPTQALTDIFTISELFPHWFAVENSEPLQQGIEVPIFWIAFVGDILHGRTVHSLARLLTHYNVGFYFSNPPCLGPPEELISYITASFTSQGFKPKTRLYLGCSLEDCLKKCDVIYMTRIQKERFKRKEDYEATKNTYCLTPECLQGAKKNVKILHPLPREAEISTTMDTTPAAAYFLQVKCGLYMRMALLTIYSRYSQKKNYSIY